MSEATHAYIGTKDACGCTVAAVVDSGAACTVTVGQMVQDGLTVRRIELAALHDGTVKLTTCPHPGK